MRHVSATLACAVLATAALGASSANAATLFGASHVGADGPSTLYRIDPSTGAASPIGPIGFERVSGIDFGPDGRLYGAGERSDGSNIPVLIVIDTGTGVGTEIGPTGLSGGSVVTDLSFRPSDGTLFAYQDAPDVVLKVDPSTGLATVLGASGPAGGGNGIAFDRANVLHLIESNPASVLYTVNQTTGAAAAIAAVPYLGFPPPAGVFRVSAMDVEPGSGRAHAVVNDGGGGSGARYLANVNFATGEVTHVGPTVPGLDALAWEPDRCRVTLYGAGKTGGGIVESTFYRIDPETGAAGPLGHIGFGNVGGIEAHPWTGVVYGVGRRLADGVQVLLTVDTLTGAGTEVGPLVNTFGNASGGGQFDLSFSQDGTLHLVAFGAGGASVSLFTVDVATGTATLVGDTLTFAGGNALGTSPGGVLVHSNADGGGARYTLNPATGAATFLTLFSYVGFPALSFPRPNAMDFDPSTGVPWLVINDSGGGGGPTYLATSDRKTGAVRFLAKTEAGMDAITWRSECDDADACTRDECGSCADVALYGATYSGANGLATLHRIDPATGATAPIGLIGFERVSAMEFDPDNGLIWATGERADGSNTNVLLVIDPSTGAGAEVGPTGIFALGGFTTVNDLAFRNSDGRLYAYLDLGDAVATLDLATGAATLVGPTNVSGFGNGFEFGAGDVLYHADGTNVNRLDQTTGAAAAGAPLSYPGFPPPAAFYRVNALDANCAGTMFAAVADSGGGATSYLGTLDAASGAVTLIGPTAAGLDALAFRTSREVCRNTYLDTDADLICDGLDCAPFDGGSWAVPPEITDDVFVDHTVFIWGDLSFVAGPGTRYDVVADFLTELPVGPAEPLAACFYGGTAIGVPDPPPGTGLWVIVRGHNACGPGSYGDQVIGGVATPRATNTCP